MTKPITLTTTLTIEFKAYYVTTLLNALDKTRHQIENSVNLLSDLTYIASNEPVLGCLESRLITLKEINEKDTQDNKKFGPTIDSLLENITQLLNNL